MKKIYKVNNIFSEAFLGGGRSFRLTERRSGSRIGPMNHRLWTVIAPMLFVAFGLFGVNEAAWGATLTAKVAVGSGKGTATVDIYNGYGQKKKTASSSSSTIATTSFGMSLVVWAHSEFSASASSGYTFKGWYTNSACTSGEQTANPYQTSTSQNQTRTDQYWAKFTPNEYTVTYDAKGGSVSPGSKKVTFDDTYGSLATPTKTGYTFDGWYTAASGGTQVTASTKVTTASDHKLYAHWTANTYHVAFNGNGATSGSMENQEFTYDADAKALTANSYGRQYTVSYDANGGTATTNATNTTATYTFKNWNKEADGSGTSYTNQYSAKNLVSSGTLNLYAQWNSDFIKLPNATKTGAVLDAWYLGDVNVEANRVGAAGDNYTPTANVTLTAKWIDKYTPEFGGSDHSMKVGDALAKAFTFNHTSNPTVHISPEGIITYDATTNKVTAVGAGTATIYFKQAETTTLFSGESDHWTFTVSRVGNTLALTSSEATKYVDEEVTGIITTKNSDAAVQTSSSDATIAYYDVDKNKIVIPNSAAKSFANTIVTIKIWQAQTVKYEASGEKTFTLTVNKYPASFTGSDYNLMVDGTQVANYVYTNTSADQPTANSSDNFYYTIDEVEFTNSAKNKGTNLVLFDPSNKQITAKNAGSAKITLHQRETYKHTAATQSFNVAVYKYNSVFAGTSTVNVKVEANATSPYTLTYEKPNNNYISSESVTAGVPSANSEDPYYYTISHNVTSTNTSGSSDATKAIAYVASSKTVTGKNAGTATVHLYQKETYKYNAADASFGVNVTKNANTIYVKGNANYSSSIYRDSYDNGLTITATNTDYANYPIQVTQTAGTDIATYYADQNAVYSSYKLGTATWSLSQPENYRYEAASGSFSVTVAQQAENTCYVLANQSDTEYGWHGNTYHEHTWNAENAAGVVNFEIYKNTGIDQGYKVQQYLNGNWVDVTDYKNDHSTSWGWKSETLNVAAKGVRFMLKGGSLNYVRNVSVTRKTYLNASDLTVDKKSDNTPVYPGEKGVGTLKIDYSLANGGDLKIANDNPDKFTVSPATISNVDCKSGTANIAIQYTSATAGTDVAHLVIYNNVYRKEVTITGKTVKRTPTVTWSSDADYFNVDDVLSATNANGLTVTLSSAGNEGYVDCEGNSATMLEATDGTITITAHVEHNNIYDDADFTKTITITNKEKQYITWDQDFSRLKTTDGTKSITLNATASSGLPVSYELAGDKTGLTLTQNGDTWTLSYSATECTNTTIVASQAGNEIYAPASSVSLPVKVIDPTKVCGTNETLVNSTVTLKDQSATYNIDIPSTMTIQVSRTKTSWAIYANGFKVEIYSGRNGTGTRLHEYSYGAGDINNSKTISLSNLNIAAKSVKLISEASNGYNVTSLTYTKQKYCNISESSLNFSTHPNTKTEAQSFNVDYANYPISLECSNDKFSFTPAGFGDCSEYGTQSVSVSYTAGAEEGNDVGYLYIKDNTGATLKTCTLNVSISKVAQSITSTNILKSYVTTDKVTLTAEANSGLTDFTYSASPEGIASFNGAEMTFVKEGTIAITVNQAGSNVYRPTSTTVQNVVVNKAIPEIATAPTGTSVAYNQTLNKSTLSGGAAETTLRDVAHTEVLGTFAWTNPTQQITDNAGTHNYSVTFTPTNGDMYTTKEFTIPVAVTRATQSIAMNNGTVKVAVDGIDAGSADSKLDLDDLILSQSSEVVGEVERTGSVSYAVISDNKDNAKIGEGNIFSATATGEYTIRATKAETDYYAQATAVFTVTVGMRANTLAISDTEFERFVDEEVTNVRSAQNSNAQVKTSSTSPTVAYYDVDNNKIVIPNSESEEQMFGNQKTVTIKIWQDATDRFEASGEKTITLTVKKYETSITGTDYVLKVNGSKTTDYAFVNTTTSVPSSNLSDDFYYTIDEPNYENAALNNGEGLITFDPNTNEIVGLNAGTTKITFCQKETRLYTGATVIRNVAVEKKTNVITNTLNTWQKAMNENASIGVSFSATHTDYTNYPIAIERVYGEDVATLSGTAAEATITTNTTQGYAVWHLSQAENYEYYAAVADLMVTVGVPAPPTCYVYEDYTEHTFSTAITDAEGHFDAPIAISAPIDKIWYKAKKSGLGYNYFVVQYSTDNGQSWKTINSPDLGDEYPETDYSATFPTMTGNKRITHVRFGAKTGATLSKWYKDVKISRKSHFNIQDAEHKNISSLPTMICTIDETSTATAKFYIDYSTCAEEIQIQSSNPEHFTVSRTKIDIAGNCDNVGSAEEITVTYNSAELGQHNAVITIRTEYQTRALSVSGETTKRTPTLEWQTGYTNNPLTLPIGLTANALNPAATSTSTAAVRYESSNESVVEIIENGYAFRVVGLGDATLTAVVPENDKWKSISDTRVIHATEKTVQEIIWDQSFPRFMELGSVVDLDAKVYLRQLSTNTLTFSATRTPYIQYSCPVNNGVVSIEGDQMTILNYGEVKVTATVSGNADYEASVPVTMLINVRQPSAGCETPLVVNRTDVIDMFEVDYDFSDYLNITTQQLISEEIAIDPMQGKPDKLSFSYSGAKAVLYFNGAIKFEQRVNSQWIAVEGSRVEAVENEWNSLTNLQLDENATALRIIRETGAKGHHKLKDIQVTRKQYLRATQEVVDLGEVKEGQTKNTTVGFEYSDVKGDLTAHATVATNGVTIANNGAIDLECGSFGHYDLPITFTPTEEGDWTGAIEVYDNIANMSVTITLTATVAANDEFVFNKAGNWNEGANWSTTQVPNDANVTVAQDAVINADATVKSISIEEGITVTVKSGVTLVVGDGTPKTQTTYGNLYVEEGAKVIIESGDVRVNNFILDATLAGLTDVDNPYSMQEAQSGQVVNPDLIHKSGNAYFDLDFDPSGKISYGWYDFTVPFSVNISGGISRINSAADRVMVSGSDFRIMEADEADRANGGKGWRNLSGNVLVPGKLYTITFNYQQALDQNTFRFAWDGNGSMANGQSYDAQYATGSNADLNGWNGMGNGMLRYGAPNGTYKTQTYSHATNTYNVVAGPKNYAVGEAFFIQVDGAGEVAWSPASESPLSAPQRIARTIDEFLVTLKPENIDFTADALYVSASEDATGEYTISHDLVKMGNPTDAKTARMWTTRGNLRLCDSEMPLVANKASFPLTFYAPKDETFDIVVEQSPADASLYLTYNDRVIWNLSMSPYTIDLTKGTTNGYGLRIVADRQTMTDVENAGTENDGVRKVLIDDHIYIVMPDGRMFDAAGHRVNE
jgi:uncharacterized repeat protein (TIGR02543 family)